MWRFVLQAMLGPVALIMGVLVEEERMPVRRPLSVLMETRWAIMWAVVMRGTEGEGEGEEGSFPFHGFRRSWRDGKVG